ncbi:MAG: hypothetical protein KDE59_25785, partial [Anaerolineales bacterium]|nr:hypothetical protein [Anaerolineales bacterium]
MVRTKTGSRAFWLLIGVVLGMVIAVLAYEAGLREPLWQRYDAWRWQRQTEAGLAQTPAPGAIPLTRTDLLYPEASAAGFAHDQALFADLDMGALTATRQANLTAEWQLAARDPAAFRDAIEPQRERLHEYLGPLPDGPVTITERHPIPLPVSFCPDGPVEAEQLAISSRWPGVALTAYLVQPAGADNGRAVVALHGHGSSPERLLGLEAEDYGRLLALRLACAGYAVIVPAVTSDGAANSAISARLTLEGATLYGLMVSQVLSSIDVLQAEFPDRPVGLYGVSNGGLLALFSNAVDERP